MVSKTTNFKVEIINLFRTDYRSRYHVRYMAQLIGVSHVTLLPHLKELEDDKILISKMVGKNKEFSLNSENLLVKDFLVISEKNNLIKYFEQNKSLLNFYKNVSRKNLCSCVVMLQKKLICIGAANIVDTEKDLLHKILKENNIAREVAALDVNNFLGMNEIGSDRILLTNTDLFVNMMWRNFSENR